jgi:hypothetical protein
MRGILIAAKPVDDPFPPPVVPITPMPNILRVFKPVLKGDGVLIAEVTVAEPPGGL